MTRKNPFPSRASAYVLNRRDPNPRSYTDSNGVVWSIIRPLRPDGKCFLDRWRVTRRYPGAKDPRHRVLAQTFRGSIASIRRWFWELAQTDADYDTARAEVIAQVEARRGVVAERAAKRVEREAVKRERYTEGLKVPFEWTDYDPLCEETVSRNLVNHLAGRNLMDGKDILVPEGDGPPFPLKGFAVSVNQADRRMRAEGRTRALVLLTLEGKLTVHLGSVLAITGNPEGGES